MTSSCHADTTASCPRRRAPGQRHSPCQTGAGKRQAATMTKQLFLPGAGGSAAFWRPVASRLGHDGPRHFFAWPGLGDEPHDPNIQGLDALVAMVASEFDEPADLIAQS